MKLIALLSLIGMVQSSAAPLRLADLATHPPWVAHLDTAKLRDSSVGTFLSETAGFDQFLKIKGTFSEKLALDLEMIDGVTLMGVGQEWRKTSMLVRGTFEPRKFAALAVENTRGIDLPVVLQGPEVMGKKVFLSRHSQKELAVGTSLPAVAKSLEILKNPDHEGWQQLGFNDEVRKKIASATALLGIDMDKIGDELDFEAELTRAMKSAWFLINSKGDDIELSFLIRSSDVKGLTFLSEKWRLFSTLLMAGEGSPLMVQQALAGQKVEVLGDWLSITMTASPKKAARFLNTMAPLFQGEPREVKKAIDPK